jgi:hypothetical protein
MGQGKQTKRLKGARGQCASIPIYTYKKSSHWHVMGRVWERKRSLFLSFSKMGLFFKPRQSLSFFWVKVSFFASLSPLPHFFSFYLP